MKNNTLQDDNKDNHTKTIAYGFEIKDPELKTLNPKDYSHLLIRPSKKAQKKYWAKTMRLILVMVILIIYLYHFYD